MMRFASLYDPEHKRKVLLGYLYDRGEIGQSTPVVLRGFWLGFVMGIAFAAVLATLLLVW